MNSLETEFKNQFSELANSENVFAQMGKSRFSMQQFFITVKDIAEHLDFRKSDVVLDAAGGAGWYSIAISPFVKQIFLFDYVDQMIINAKENILPFSNITAYVDDLLTLNQTHVEIGSDGRVDKIIVGSALQYFSDHSKIETIFKNLFNIMDDNGKAILTLNPDLRKKQEHIASYARLDWSKERIQKGLENEEKRLWLDMDIVSEIANRVGFKKCYETPIDKSIWQSTHMFNFIVEK
jgi:protein-L-isoaspartate O-methyltransferase